MKNEFLRNPEILWVWKFRNRKLEGRRKAFWNGVWNAESWPVEFRGTLRTSVWFRISSCYCLRSYDLSISHAKLIFKAFKESHSCLALLHGTIHITSCLVFSRTFLPRTTISWKVLHETCRLLSTCFLSNWNRLGAAWPYASNFKVS